MQRAWTQLRLKPHQLDRYLAANDPQFEEKATDIIGLYLHPPQHAAVFCVDEKTAIQALDRLDPVLPLSPGRAERHDFEYFRQGTLSLYAVLDVKTGQMHGMPPDDIPAKSSLRFWKELVAQTRWAKEILSCSKISRHIKLRTSSNSWPSTRRFVFTLLRPIPPG